MSSERTSSRSLEKGEKEYSSRKKRERELRCFERAREGSTREEDINSTRTGLGREWLYPLFQKKKRGGYDQKEGGR